MTKTYIEYFYPGSFVSETSIEEVKDRTITKDIPKGAYCFRFFDREEIEVNGEVLRGKAKNHSKEYYPDAELYDVERVMREVTNPSILIRNMEGNGWKQVVKSRRGNFQPYDPEKVEIV